MKYIALSSLLFFLSFNGIAQSKADTEEWIKAQIQDYHARDKYGYNNYQILFDKGYLIVIRPTIKGGSYEKIPLKSINQVSVMYFKREEYEGYEIKFRCKSSEKCVESGLSENGEYIPSGNNLSVADILFDVSFKNDNLPIRMKKAIKHLIELNGGKLISDTF